MNRSWISAFHMVTFIVLWADGSIVIFFKTFTIITQRKSWENTFLGPNTAIFWPFVKTPSSSNRNVWQFCKRNASKHGEATNSSGLFSLALSGIVDFSSKSLIRNQANYAFGAPCAEQKFCTRQVPFSWRQTETFKIAWEEFEGRGKTWGNWGQAESSMFAVVIGTASKQLEKLHVFSNSMKEDQYQAFSFGQSHGSSLGSFRGKGWQLISI